MANEAKSISVPIMYVIFIVGWLVLSCWFWLLLVFVFVLSLFVSPTRDAKQNLASGSRLVRFGFFKRFLPTSEVGLADQSDSVSPHKPNHSVQLSLRFYSYEVAEVGVQRDVFVFLLSNLDREMLQEPRERERVYAYGIARRAPRTNVPGGRSTTRTNSSWIGNVPTTGDILFAERLRFLFLNRIEQECIFFSIGDCGSTTKAAREEIKRRSISR